MDLNLLLNDLTVLLPAAVRLQRLAVAVRAEFQCDAVVILALEPGGSSVNDLRALDTDALISDRYDRFRSLGVFSEPAAR